MKLKVTFEDTDSRRWLLVDEGEREGGNSAADWTISAEAAVQAKALLRGATSVPVTRDNVTHSVRFTGAHNVTDEGAELTEAARAFCHAWNHIKAVRGAAGKVVIVADGPDYGFTAKLTNAVLRRVELVEWMGCLPRFTYDIDFAEVTLSS